MPAQTSTRTKAISDKNLFLHPEKKEVSPFAEIEYLK
jgi:hypothetical protein